MNSVDPATRDFVINGVLSDTISANDAIKINLLIGSFHKEINDKGHGLFFSYVQSVSDHTALISIRRLFEKLSERCSNRSIFSLFNHLKKCKLPVEARWPNIEYIETNIISLKCAKIINAIELRDIASLLAEIENAAQSLKRDLKIDDALRRVRDLADKEVAHNENVKVNERASYGDLLFLLNFVKDVFALVIHPVCGWSYSGGRVQEPIGGLAKLLSGILGIPINEIWEQHKLRQKNIE